MTLTAPRVTLTPVPRPLTPNTHRAIANSIATELRHGWRPNRTTRALNNPRSRDMHPPAVPHPKSTDLEWRNKWELTTTEQIDNQPYTWGIIDPTPTLQIPMLAWHVLYYDAAAAIQTDRRDVDTFLKHRPAQGAPPLPFRTRPNRHGTPSLRRNSDYAPLGVAAALLAVAATATIWELDPHEAYDLMGDYDVIEASITLALIENAYR